VRLEDAPRIFGARPAKTWADEVLTGAAIELRLWTAYEARFKRNHELSLAYRYLPATDEERALVSATDLCRRLLLRAIEREKNELLGAVQRVPSDSDGGRALRVRLRDLDQERLRFVES
jgi:hypothetical protein